MKIAPLSVVILFLFLFAVPAQAKTATKAPTKPRTPESDFKAIAKKIATMDQKAIKAGKAGPDWAEKSQAYRKSLKKLVKADPTSEWADDAQYLVGVLSEAERLDVPEKEFFIKTYPDAKAEEWTQKTLDYIVPTKLSLDLSVRMDLCLAYLRRQEKDNLKKLADESSAKYPDRAMFFSTLVKRSETQNQPA